MAFFGAIPPYDPTLADSDQPLPPLGAVGRALPLHDWDEKAFTAADLRERMRLSCHAWAGYGFGAPPAAYAFYLIKHYVWFKAWLYFCGFGPDAALASAPLSLALLTRDTMARLVVFNLLFEVAGVGCACGPLTARFLPPFSALPHWLWVGSVKMPYRFDLRDGRRGLVGGTTRTRVDVALFLVLVVCCLRALYAPSLGAAEAGPVVFALAVLGVLDTTIILASRFEVYGYMTACIALSSLADDPDAALTTALKVVQLGIWLWASISKWGPWFPLTVQVMLTNSMTWPFTTKAFRRALFADLSKSDLRASFFCKALTHAGSLTEFLFPLALCSSTDATRSVALFVMCGFHAFIFSQVAMAAPQEWNIFTVMNGLYLFRSAGLSSADVRALPGPLLGFLVLVELLVPALGNLKSKYVSFLPAMRYYAGNWPISVWMVKRSAYHKLARIPSVSGSFYDQAFAMYGVRGVRQLVECKIMAFISMHNHGRLLPKLMPLAVGGADRIDDHMFFLGEFMAAQALGYNFGDGHLHGSLLLDAIQGRCGFEKGECVQIFIDSCPATGSEFPWFIRDATAPFDAVVSGAGNAAALAEGQPY